MINTILIFCSLLVQPDTTELLSFIPEKHKIIGIYPGDINNDKTEDIILVTGNEQLTADSTVPMRTTTLLVRHKNRQLQKAASNHNVVLCDDCGGAFGNPFTGIDIKDGTFTVNHYGGSATRWTVSFSFIYDSKNRNWYLKQISRSWFNIYQMEEPEEEITLSSEKITFEAYDGNW